MLIFALESPRLWLFVMQSFKSGASFRSPTSGRASSTPASDRDLESERFRLERQGRTTRCCLKLLHAAAPEGCIPGTAARRQIELRKSDLLVQ